MGARRRRGKHGQGELSFAELGALVVCLEELEHRNPGCGALAKRDAVIDARLRRLTADEVREHFSWVPGRDAEPLWCRAPRVGAPPYRFVMGSPRDEEGRLGDEDQVQAELSAPFWLAATPVTVTQFRLMRRRVAALPQSTSYDDWSPITGVSWFDAFLYCAWLQHQRHRPDLEEAWREALDGIPDAYRLCLPTEAQWEFACRAWWPNQGRAPRFWSGDAENDLAGVAWYQGVTDEYNENDEDFMHWVASREGTANAWGLYDMHGNAWEWCRDWYEAELPGGGDPQRASSGVGRVFRGGCYSAFAWHCRSASRACEGPGFADFEIGFRVVLAAPDS